MPATSDTTGFSYSTPASPDTTDLTGATSSNSQGSLFSATSSGLQTLDAVITTILSDNKKIAFEPFNNQFTLSDGTTGFSALHYATVIELTGLDGLANVNITNIADNEIISYDSSTSKYVNAKLAFDNIASGVVLDSDTMSGASATTLATSESIKAYVDSQVTAQDLDFQGDAGGALSIDLDSETLILAGGTGITTTGSNNTMTFAVDAAQSGITSLGDLTGLTIDGDVTFTGASYNALWDKSQNSLEFADDARATFGTDRDLQFYHNGTNAILENYTGDTFITNYTDDKDIILRTDNGNGGVAKYIVADGDEGEVKLYHAASGSSSVKLTTKSTGVDITGVLTTTGNIELGHASDNTLSASSGILSIEGKSIVDTASTGLTKSDSTLSIDNTVAVLTGNQTFTDKIINADNNTISNLEVDNLKSGVLDTDLGDVSSNDDTLASAKAIKAYVDAHPGDITGVTAGNGLTGGGNSGALTLAVGGTTNRISVSDDAIDIDSNYVGQDSITTLGTITTGTWNGTAIANGNLANSSITVTDGSNSTATALGGTITFNGTANEIEVGEASGTITVGLPNNVTIAGNLTVNGTTTTINTENLSVEDPLIKLAKNNNTDDSLDIGFYGLYDTSGSQDLYAGLFRDANDSGKFKLFKDLQAEPGTTVDTGGTGYTAGTLVANLESAELTVTGDATFTGASYNAVWQKTYNNLRFNDNASLALGSGSAIGDFRMSHSSTSNGTFMQNYTGDLVIRQSGGQNADIKIEAYNQVSSTTNYIVCDSGEGEVKLYYAASGSSSVKLKTQSTGINVIGTVTDDGATHDGDVTFTGANYNVVWDKSDDALEFPANAKAKFGSDLEIFSNGSNGVIKDVGSGNLQLAGSVIQLRNSSNNENMLKGNENGSVELYHDGIQKLVTMNDGIDVTGKVAATSLQASGDLTIDTSLLKVDSLNDKVGIGTASPDYLLHISGANTSSPSAMLALEDTNTAYNSTNPHPPGGGITFRSLYQSGSTNTVSLGTIQGIKENTTNANSAGALRFLTKPNGSTLNERLRIDSTGNVGIGTTSPSTKLDVVGDITAKTSDGAILNLQTSDTEVTTGEVLGAIHFQAPDEEGGNMATEISAVIQAEASSNFLTNNNETDLVFKVASDAAATERMRLNSTGKLTLTELQVNGDVLLGDAGTGGTDSILKLGAGNDLQIYHDASGGGNGKINNDTGHLYITQNANDKNLYLMNDAGDGNTTAYITLDGDAEQVLLKNLTVYASGGDVTLGNYVLDSDQTVGSSQDNYVLTYDNSTGKISLEAAASGGSTAADSLTGTTLASGVTASSLTSVGELTGLTVNGTTTFNDDVTFTGTGKNLLWDKSINHLSFDDDVRASFGNSGDFKIRHQSSGTGGNETHLDNTTGNLNIVNFADDKDIILSSDDGSNGTTAYITLDGSEGEVNLYHAASGSSSVKLATKSTGIEIQGVSGGTAGTITLNCPENSHGVKIQSPAHSAAQSYTLKLPDNQIAANKILKVKSITGSGATAVGQLEFADESSGSGGGVTVQNAGSALSTTATTLNFTGDGVTASGTGATKTINIPGGGSGSGMPTTGGTFTGDVTFTGDSYDMMWDKSTSDLKIFGIGQLQFLDSSSSSSPNFSLFHNTSTDRSYISSSVGEFNISNYDVDQDILIRNDSGIGNGSVSNYIVVSGSTGEVRLAHYSDIKLTTKSGGVEVTGTLTASDNITAYSDERLKSDIKTIDNALDKVMNMRGVSYTKEEEKSIGVIAQEVEKVIPEVVTDGEYKSVAYGNMVGVLIEAIKEQQKQIDELKKLVE